MKELSKEKLKYFQEKYIDRYVKERNNENWQAYRSSKKFIKKISDFSFLKNREINFPIDENNNLRLQESRGIGIEIDAPMSVIYENIKSIMSSPIEASNQIRITEIDSLIKQNNIDFANRNYLEIGFRVPKVQSYFRKKHNMNDHGLDINKFNCELFNELGYNVSVSDINKENIEFFNDKKFDIVSCYHVLEHTFQPEKAIINIYNNMTAQSILHIEIPIEGDNPQLNYGHLVGFYPQELGSLLKHVGFNIVYGTNKTHTGGSYIERYIATKGY